MKRGDIEMANKIPDVIFFIGAGFSRLFIDIMRAALLLKKL